jgi:hypothetical protein
MIDKPASSDESFLSRWSRRKVQTRNEPPTETTGPAPAADSPTAIAPASSPTEPKTCSRSDLPALETLTPESDFRPFMGSEVEARVKNRALKTLFKDPHFNVMDGLDTYIGDYSKPDPIPEEMLSQLNQLKNIFVSSNKEQGAPAEVASVPEIAQDSTLVAAAQTTVSIDPNDASKKPVSDAVGVGENQPASI